MRQIIRKYLPVTTAGGPSLANRFARGAVWSLISAVVGQGSALAAAIITARILGVTGFGELGIIQSTIGMLSILAGAAIGLTATKYVAEFRTTHPMRAGNIVSLTVVMGMLVGLLAALLVFPLSSLVAAKVLNAPNLQNELPVAAFLILTNAVSGAQMGSLAGLEAFRLMAGVNLARGLITLPISVLLVVKFGLHGAVWGLVLTAAAGCIIADLALREECRERSIPLRLAGAFSEWRVLLQFSIPVFLSGTLSGPVSWIGNTVLVNQPSGYAEMGVFAATNHWKNVIVFVPGVLGQLTLPLLANLRGTKEHEGQGQVFFWSLFATGTLALLAAIPVCIGAKMIMRMYGAGFSRGWLVLVIAAGTAVLSALGQILGYKLASAGEVWVTFLMNTLWSLVFISAVWLFIPRWHAMGLALCYLVAFLVQLAVLVPYMMKRRGHPTQAERADYVESVPHGN